MCAELSRLSSYNDSILANPRFANYGDLNIRHYYNKKRKYQFGKGFAPLPFWPFIWPPP